MKISKPIKTIIIAILSLFVASICNKTTFAADMPATVYLKPSLTLSIPKSSIALTLDPSSTAFSSDSISIEVGTNNILGYKLYVSTVDSSTNLVNTVDSTKYIETLSSSTSSGSFPANKWGYKLNNGNFIPFVSGSLISSSTGPVNSDTTTFTVGAKVDYTKDSGTYNTNLSFNVLPEVELHYLQDFATDPTLKDTLCLTGYPTLVTDKRDNKTYYIQRLKDGKCWMIQNLRLGEDLEPVTGSLTLTDQDTDISTTDAYNPRSEFVLTNKLPDGTRAPSTDTTAFSCREEYGCYYNFYTANAGLPREGEGIINADNTDYSTTICPKGWTLPTGGAHKTSAYPTHSSDLYLLYNAYKYGTDSTATVVARLLVKPTNATENIYGSYSPGLLLTGYYTVADYGWKNSYGYLWSRTVQSATVVYQISYTATGYWVSTSSRPDRKPVRCLLIE